MNVIEKLLTTKNYVHINAIKEIKKALMELSETKIDFSNKNAAYEFKDAINKTLRDILKDVPYDFSSKYNNFIIKANDLNQINSLGIYRLDNIHQTVDSSPIRLDRNNSRWSDLVCGPNQYYDNSYRLTNDASSSSPDQTPIQSAHIRAGNINISDLSLSMRDVMTGETIPLEPLEIPADGLTITGFTGDRKATSN